MDIFWQKVLVVLVSVLVIVSGNGEPLKRRKRMTVQSCAAVPETDLTNIVVDRSATLKLSCNTDTAVSACMWLHTKPQNEGKPGAQADVVCTGTSSLNNMNCDTYSRVKFEMESSTKCGISIANPEPDDAGNWRLITTGLASTGDQAQNTYNFKVYTYNMTSALLTDNRDQPIRGTIETTYNYNDKTEKWEIGKGGWETLEFRCKAAGARPKATFRWFIDNDNSNPLQTSEGFTITEESVGNSDREGFVPNYASRISFPVDDKLKARLAKQNINTNPNNGVLSFELRCEVMQGTYTVSDRPAVRINIKKTYDDGKLATGAVAGIVVGVLVAVIVVGVAIGLVIFAMSNERWCFASEENKPKPINKSKPTSAQVPRVVHGKGAGPILKSHEAPIFDRNSSSKSSNNSSRKSQEVNASYTPPARPPKSSSLNRNYTDNGQPDYSKVKAKSQVS